MKQHGCHSTSRFGLSKSFWIRRSDHKYTFRGSAPFSTTSTLRHPVSHRKFLDSNPVFSGTLGAGSDLEICKKVSDLMPRVKEDEPNIHRTMHVVNHIRSLIENGTLQPGDKIPPEREFARTLKISRASLRTGIGYLAAMGVMKV
ncbi:MAG: winged helix-turn-helix domain-containing protein, partial [Terracidiphilus sp.]